MRLREAWKPILFAGFATTALDGCTPTGGRSTREGAATPFLALELPPAPNYLPAPPVRQAEPSVPPKKEEEGKDELLPLPRQVESASFLYLEEVLKSVEQHFPLLLAVEQERFIAAGQRLAAEGAFDLNLRARGTTQGGTFPNNRFDMVTEQATPYGGLSFFSGYRFGFNDFPVYYGDRQTADGGEFRAGAVLPLLKDGPIDRRRAAVRQAQIQQAIADPVVQRARIDYLRGATRAYWSWTAAGEQYSIAEALLRIARERQAGFEEQFKRGQISEFVVIDNRRLIAEREGNLLGADRRYQQTALDLSLFLRDDDGNPVVPTSSRLPRGFASQDPTLPNTARLKEDIETAYGLRPELMRFALLKDRVSVDLRLAQNQTLPALNAAVTGSQDVGKGKTSTGIFALDRSNVEASLLLDVPLQRREATGRVRAAEAQLLQIHAQERFARDQIAVEVQDAVSNLDRTYQRLLRAREEQRIADRVADLERDRFQKGQGTLLEVNLRELAAAGARAKVVDTLADYFRAQADHRAALGIDASTDARHDLK